MKISICIPHYNRIGFLRIVLASIAEQTYKNIEVIVSDDCSTDDSERVLRSMQASFPFPLVYERQISNIGYDANLRRSLELATGDYLFVLGNDDALVDHQSIDELVSFISRAGSPGLLTCNYREYSDESIVYRRVQEESLVAGTIEAAMNNYSCFSFVAGIGFRRDVFQEVNTVDHDGSIYVQIYMAVMAMLKGYELLKIEKPLVAKDVTLQSEKSNSYRDKIQRNWSGDLSPVTGGMPQVIAVFFDAIDRIGVNDAVHWKQAMAAKIYSTTYPFWLLDYRRNKALPEAFRLMKGMRPVSNREVLGPALTQKLKLIYLRSTIGGLLFPVKLFNRMEGWLYSKFKGK